MKITLIAILLTTALEAQSISGIVKDPQNKAIPGASIALFARDGDARGNTTSDPRGAYRFDSLAPGDYILQAEAHGFSHFVTQQIQIAHDANLTFDLPLQLAATQQQVVVTASSTPQTADEVSKALTVVDNDDIERRDEFLLPEALRPTPGLRVQQLGGPGGFTSIRIRGLRDQDTAVLIDGMRFRDAAATQADASGLIEDMLVTDVDRVEILRGSGSSLYGTNAIGGVINVITDEGGGRTRGSIQLEGGSLGLMRGRAHMAGGLKHDRIQYSLSLAELDVTRGIDNDSPDRNLSGQGRIAFHLTPTTQLIARFFGASTFAKVQSGSQTIGNFDTTNIVTAIPLPLSQLKLYESGVPLSQLAIGNANFIPSADDPDSTRVARFLSGALTLLGHPSPSIGYSVSYQGLSTARSFGNGPAGVGLFQPTSSTRSDFDGEIHTINAHVDIQAGHLNLLTAGYEFEDENYGAFSDQQFDPAATARSNVTERSHSAFVQDQVRLFGDRLQISGAFRAQVFSLETPQFFPSATAPYQDMTFAAPPTAYTGDGSIAYFIRRSGTKFRAHAGRGYRAPSLFERFGAGFDENFGYTVYGDPRLRPERSIAFDAGLDQAFWNQRIHASATYFYTRLQSVIVFDGSGLINPAADPFGRFIGYINSQGGLARGAEASARVAATKSLDISAAYTYTNAIEKTPIVGDVLRSFLAPRNQVSIIATQRIGQRFFVSFDMTAASNYVGEVFGDTVTAAMLFPGIKKLDLGASYRLPLSEFRAVRFFAKADNLLNQTYYESGYRTPGITGVGGLQFEF